MRKGLHVTHNDADAVGCTVVASFMPDIEWTNVYCKVTGADKALEENFMSDDIKDKPEIVIISDICISDEMAEKLEAYRVNNPSFEICLIDHHITNSLAPKYSWAYVRVQNEDGIMTSAALNMLEIFGDKLKASVFEDEIDQYKFALEDVIESISRYDTWEWKKHPVDYKEDEFKIVVGELGCEEASSLIVRNICSKASRVNGIYHWDEFSRKLIDMYKTNETYAIEEVIKNPIITDIFLMNQQYKAALIVCDRKYGNSQMTAMYETYNEIDLVVGLYTADHTVSLRTNKPSINVSEIAKWYGGGGHVAAAGFKAPVKDFLDILHNYYIRKDENR